VYDFLDAHNTGFGLVLVLAFALGILSPKRDNKDEEDEE